MSDLASRHRAAQLARHLRPGSPPLVLRSAAAPLLAFGLTLFPSLEAAGSSKAERDKWLL